jgi:hypothetical protein
MNNWHYNMKPSKRKEGGIPPPFKNLEIIVHSQGDDQLK